MSRLNSALIILSGILLSCGSSKNTRFFLPTSSLSAEQRTGDDMVLGIRSVEFPEFLKNDYMPESVEDNELKRDEFLRWAEPFPDVFESQLVASLKHEGVGHPIVEPWPSFFTPLCSLWVRVNRWSVTEESVDVKVTWALIRSERGNRPEFRSFNFSDTRNRTGPSSYAELVTQVANRLGSEMAPEVKTQNECQAQYIDKK